MGDKNGGSKSRNVPDWKRPAGPLNVWRVIEGVEKQPDGQTRRVRLSIQDVPEDRYRETVSLMCQYFMADEATCKSLKLSEDADAKNDFTRVWDWVLKQGISVGAFKLDEQGKLLELVAVNMLFVVSQEAETSLENIIKNFESTKASKLFDFVKEVSEAIDVFQIYKVDKYISALGLVVLPAFRGQNLAVELLKARDDIGRKYDISATSTIFTGPASQKQAERAGFETAHVQIYSEVLDTDGKPLFPNIQATSTKMMIKRIE